MNKLLSLASICIISLSFSLCAQPTSGIPNWVQQQEGGTKSENITDYIESIGSNPQITFGHQYMFSSTPSSNGSIETLTDTTFVIVYYSFSKYSSCAIIGTVSDTVITYGPEIVFNKAATSVCLLDSNTLLFTTESNNGSTVLVGNVTGNSISFGNESTYSNVNTEYSSVVALDNENFIISYSINYTYHDNEIFVKKGKLLGNTIQLSDSISVDEGHVTSLGSVTLDSSNFVVYYECNGGFARPGTIVGDSIELGPVSAFTSGWNPWYMTATKLCDTTFVMGYGYWGFCGLGLVGTLNNNSITFGTPVVFDSTRVEGIYSTTMDNNHFVFSYCDRETGLETTSTVVLGSVSGYNITFGDEYTSSIYTSTQRSPVTTLNSNQFVVGLIDFTQSWAGGAKIGTIGAYPIQTILGNEISCEGVSPVPILVNSIDQITRFSLFIEYDTSHLSYLSYQNLNSQLIEDSLNITNDNGIINIQYSSDIPINISSDTLMDILFDIDAGLNGNTNQLNWNDTLSVYINNFSDTISSQFTNGTLSTFEPIGTMSQISGNDSVCIGIESEIYTISSIDNCQSYTWEIIPDSAGQIQANDTIAVLSFAPDFAGDILLSVFGTNLCGNSDTAYFGITVLTNPTSNAGSDATICENSNHMLNGTATSYHYTYWNTLGDGSFDDPFLLNATYTPGNQDIVNGSVDLILYAFPIQPCMYEIRDTITLSIAPLPSVFAGEDLMVCPGAACILNGEAENYSTIFWSSQGDGVFEDPTQLSTFYYAGENDSISGNVTLNLSATSLHPCIDTISDSILISFIDFPQQPDIPVGPQHILLDTCTSTEYHINTVPSALSYQWILEPAESGIVIGNGINAIVDWNIVYSGLEAYLSVDAINTCGSTRSDSLKVNLGHVGIPQQSDPPLVQISPNPSQGIFNISLNSNYSNVDLYVKSNSGRLIMHKKLLITDGTRSYTLDLKDEPSGIYHLTFVFEQNEIKGYKLIKL